MSFDIEKKVVCSSCGKEYMCTPSNNYFNFTTNTDGVCWDCMIKAANLKPQEEPGPKGEFAIG